MDFYNFSFFKPASLLLSLVLQQKCAYFIFSFDWYNMKSKDCLCRNLMCQLILIKISVQKYISYHTSPVLSKGDVLGEIDCLFAL